jgi:RND family efflux transporter MFP subunit
VTASTRALTLEAIVPNPQGRLKPGFFATAQIEEANKRPGILVPSQAVRTIAGTARVFVINNDRAEERVVMTGQAVGDQVEIASGLKAGEKVATNAINQLVDGVRVAVR